MAICSFGDIWAKREAERDAVVRRGQCLIQFFGRMRFQVYCPQDARFIEQAHRMGGAWRRRSKMWTFKAALANTVIKVCCEIWPGKVIVRPHHAPEYRPKIAGLPAITDALHDSSEGV